MGRETPAGAPCTEPPRRHSTQHVHAQLPRLALATVWLLSGCLALVACSGPSSAVAPTPTPKATSTATATPQPTVLFQADWSHGLAGWHASAGWTVVGGALQSDAGTVRSVTIPYQPAGPDYVVEFQLEVVDLPVNGGFFRLHALPVPGADGYEAGVFGLLMPGHSQFGLHPTSFTSIDPPGAQDPATATTTVHDFEPRDTVHDYRVAVHGPAISYYIDNIFNSSAPSIETQRLSAGPILLECSEAAVRISSLEIISSS